MKVLLALGFAALAAFGGSQTIVAKPFASGFSAPMQYVQNPQNATYGYVLERAGTIKLVLGGVTQPTNVLDISTSISTDGEGGLLGMALDPNFATNRYFYLNVTTNATTQTHIWRFTMSADGKTASAASKLNIITIGQPYTNHNGGSIHFGQDGYLYIGMGDGGGANDQDLRAQNPTQLLGKFLRIDPSHDAFPGDANRNYAIPASNPFFGADPYGLLDEVWSIGVRNPFRWSFDSLTGAMLIGDVGQDSYEEVDYEPAGKGGRNYGWSQREGRHATGLPGTLLIAKTWDPFIEVPHPTGEALIGGFVYRGTALGPSFYGRYFFGDEVNAKVWSAPIQLGSNGEALAADANVLDHTASINASLPGALANPVSFDPDANGEVIVTDLSSGQLFRLAIGSKTFPPAGVGVTVGTLAGGNLQSLYDADGSLYQVNSRMIDGFGQTAAFVSSFRLDRKSTQFTSLNVQLKLGVALHGVVDFYGYNWLTKKYMILTTFANPAGMTSKTVRLSLGTAYYSPLNTMSILLRAHVPSAYGTSPFVFRADQFSIAGTF